MRSKNLLYLLLIAGIGGFIFQGCEGDYRQKASGSFGEVIVVMDSSNWQSPTAEAIRNTFAEDIMTLPQPEAKFDLTFTDFETQGKLDQIKKLKNVIFAAPLNEDTNVGSFITNILGAELKKQVRSGESFAFQLNNKWYRDQWTLFLTSNSQDSLAANIRENGEEYVQTLVQKEIERWKENIYDQGEQFALEDSLWKRYGWKIRIQHDYVLNVDTTNFVTLRRYLPKNDRWIWAWWRDGVANPRYVDSSWINNMRDSLMKQYIRGTRDSSYVTTEYRRPVNTEVININDYYAWRTRGTWQMTEDFMGGPFVNYTIYDDVSNRLFMIEFSQFAPKYKKRRFIRQFMAMAQTFKSDSTWVTGGNPEMETEEKPLQE